MSMFPMDSSMSEETGASAVTKPFRIAVLTIFPEMITGYSALSILGRAQREGHLALDVHDLRDGATDERRSVDDAPFGGGAGMVLAPAPIFRLVERVDPPRPIILLGPAGRPFTQEVARELAEVQRPFTLLCGRYEGIDQRVIDGLVTQEISLGDYVLAGGELAALVVIEAVARLLPGVLGNESSSIEESFSEALLEYPQYTRPAEFHGKRVPEVLLSGDHGAIAKWRLAASLARTLTRRPDLITARGGLREDEVELLSQHGYPLETTAPASARIFSAASSGDAFVEERTET